jgi:AcrR family transcriptional regulator
MSAAPSRIAQRRSAALAEGGAEYSSKRAELIRAAATVFREKGYSATTLNDIASVFGTDRASLYYYVGSKEELFQACIMKALTDNMARATAITQQELGPRERLTALVDLLITSQEEHYPYLFVYIQENMDHVVTDDSRWGAEMVAATHEFERFFIKAITDGIEEGVFRSDLSPTLIANSLFGMTQWTHRWWVPGGKYSAAELIHVFSSVLFEGIDERPARH